VDGRDKPDHDDVESFDSHDAFRCGGVSPSSQSCSLAIASQPIDTNDTAEGRQRNRRTELKVEN
jgi:hypothetical protein